MNSTISNNGRPGFTPATGTSKGGTKGGAATTGAPASPGGSAPAASDQLKLTDSARALQQAARPDGASTVDTQKVARIRQSIADGSYQINAGNIADRLISLDHQIGGTGKA